MNFRIRGLDPQPFRPFFAMDDAALGRAGIVSKVADSKPGFPCRVSLADAEPGQRVLLLNYEHLPVETPYRSRHAIYVSDAFQPFNAVNAMPQALRDRLLAIRAFDAAGMMVDADIAEGREAEPLIARLLGLPGVQYLHAHYARRGCFAARIERASA